MELDDLKYQLRNRLDANLGQRSTADLAFLLGKRTDSLLQKIQRNLWMEIIFSILILAGFGLIAFLTNYPAIRIYFLIFILPCAAFTVVLYILLKRTRALSSSALPVKSNLQEVIKLMEEFIKRYFQFTMAMIPLAVVFAFISFQIEQNRIPAADHLFNSDIRSSWRVIVFIAVYIGILSVATWYFTKWYLQKLYGRYVAQLKRCVEELEEESNL